MNEMIERSGRALYQASREFAPPNRPPDAEEKARFDKWCDLARATIKPLREPTTDQIDRALHDYPAPPGPAPSKVWLRGFFRAMIAEALRDG